MSISRPDALLPETKVTWHSEQITAAIDGEVIVMGMIRGQYVGLDDIGSVLWKLLEQPQTIRQLCDELGLRYQGNSDTILADVTAFLEDLRSIDLIEIVDAGSTR